MRRTPWFRLLAMVLAIWLPLILGEPGVVHACAAHGAAASNRDASSGVAAHGNHHSSGHHAAPQGSQRQGKAPSHDHQSCTCISCCAGSADAAPSPAAPITDFVAAVHVTGAAPSTVGSLPRPAPQYSQPYTTGPPRA